MNVRTTPRDLTQDMLLFLDALYAHRAAGDDLDEVIRRMERAIRKRLQREQSEATA